MQLKIEVLCKNGSQTNSEYTIKKYTYISVGPILQYKLYIILYVLKHIEVSYIAISSSP